MELYKKVEYFVTDAFTKADNKNDVKHALLTVKWIKRLKPQAGEALLIAGVAHDIERAFYGDWKKGSVNKDLIRKHQKLSADVIEKYLRKKEVDEELIKEVRDLIEHHEEGGNENQNILCDADSLAFLEDKALRWARRFKKEGRINDARIKFRNMYKRIHSKEARSIAKKWHDEALEELDK